MIVIFGLPWLYWVLPLFFYNMIRFCVFPLCLPCYFLPFAGVLLKVILLCKNQFVGFLFTSVFFRLQAFYYYNASLRFGVLLHPNITDISEKLFPCTAKNA